MSTIPLFVFGTLRVGLGNYSLFGEACHSAFTGVTTPGRMYYAAYGNDEYKAQAGYPCVRFNEDGTVIGDLLIVEEDHPNTHMVHRMEIGAGYVMTEVTVTLEDGREVTAIAYDWPEDGVVGDPIASGNYEREKAVRW